MSADHADVNDVLMCNSKAYLSECEVSELEDEDIKAVYKYLRTVKPIKNKVPESVPLNNHENLAQIQE